jgi:hypothetical protein
MDLLAAIIEARPENNPTTNGLGYKINPFSIRAETAFAHGRGISPVFFIIRVRVDGFSVASTADWEFLVMLIDVSCIM